MSCTLLSTVSVQENHELPPCYVMISVSFEQSWGCLHAHSHLPVNKHTVHTAAAKAMHAAVGLTTGFYAVQYWYQQRFNKYQGGQNSRSK